MSIRTPLHDLTTRAGAAFAEDTGWLVPARFGDVAGEYRQAREGGALFDVSHRGKVELTGPEAAPFLNNLCTNDIRNLTPGRTCEAFFTTAKARVVVPVLIDHLRFPDGRDVFWLETAPGLADRLLKHLDHYLISEQVEILDRTADFAELHLAGPWAGEVLKALGGDLADLAEGQVVTRQFGTGAGHVRRSDALGVPGYDLIVPPGDAVAVWQALVCAGARPAGLEAYEILRVEAGTPVFGKDMAENRFVVEVGRGTRAICYTKGCYLGQEPIVMARDRGQVNRMLLGLKVQGEGAVPHGARVLRDGGEVGQVTSSVVSPRLGTIALAYLRRGNQEPGTAVVVETPAGTRAAEVVSLPFSGAGTGGGAGPG
jgi:folate-binding protein YgfZ